MFLFVATLGRFDMLVLSRRKNESIVLGPPGDLAIVTVVELRGDKVRLGIETRPEWVVHRQEVYDAIKQEEDEKK
jgi:carbon storage regulator